MDTGSHAERMDIRYPFAVNILINGKVMVKGIDISMGGLYVYTGRSFDRGRIVDISIPDYSFQVKGRVQHNQPGVGMGLKFLGLNDVQKGKLRLLIQTLDTGTVDLSRKVKPEVLIIDDNQISRRINKSKLNLEGFLVTEANDGLEAIKVMRDRVPDVIVCDLMMEGMDGLKFLSMVRTTQAWRDIPVIIMSGMASVDVIDRVYEAGADEFLAKGTTTPLKLAEHVKTIMQQKSE